MGLSSVSISSNIHWLLMSVSSLVFQLFAFFSGFSSLNFAGIQQSSKIFIGRGGGHPPQQWVVPQCCPNTPDFSALFASESQCRCWQNCDASDLSCSAGVSKEIHNVRAASSDWSELAHLVHRVLSFIHCNIQCLEQFLPHASGEIQVSSCIGSCCCS